MTKKIKTLLSIAVLAVFFCLGIASSPKNGVYSDYDKWIPEDFNPNKGVLLIEVHPLTNKQNERMIKFLDDHYPYQYEIVKRSAIKDTEGKYADTKKYPFAIMWRESTSTSTSMGSNGRMSTNYKWDMYGYFYDRAAEKTYPSTKRSNVYGQIGYRPVFNSIVKKFKDK